MKGSSRSNVSRQVSRAIGFVVGGGLLTSCQLLLGIEERQVGVEPSVPGVDAALDVAPPPSKSCALQCGSDCVTDPASDSEHCGSCDRSCRGGACRGGFCEPELVLDVPTSAGVFAAGDEIIVRVIPKGGETQPDEGELVALDTVTHASRKLGPAGFWLDMVVDGADAFIVEHVPAAQVRRLDLRSKESTILHRQTTKAPAFRKLALDRDELFWTTRGDLRAVRRDGTGYRVLKTITEGEFGATPALVAETSRVFFGIEDTGVIWDVPRNGGEAKYADMGDPLEGRTSAAIRWDDRMLWWSQTGIRTVAISGGPTRKFVRPFTQPHGVARDGAYVYFGDRKLAAGGNLSEVFRYRPDTRELTRLATVKDHDTLAVVGDWIYFAAYAGGVYRIPK